MLFVIRICEMKRFCAENNTVIGDASIPSEKMRSCNDSSGKSTLSHRGGLGSIPGQFLPRFMVDKLPIEQDVLLVLFTRVIHAIA